MRMALVAGSLPDPPLTTSRLRIMHLAKAMAQHGRVQLFSALRSEDLEAEARRGGKAFPPFSRVVTHALHPKTWGWRVPPEVQQFPDVLCRALAAANEAQAFDVVVLATVHASRAIEMIPRTAVILDVPRIESLARERRMRWSGANAVSRLIQLCRWRTYEQSIWKQVDAITAARVSDIPLLHTHRPDTAVHIPNGIDTSAHGYGAPSQRGGNAILFCGPLWYEPNIESVTVLAEMVFPEVRRLVPEAVLTIAGRNPSRRVQALESDRVRVVATPVNLSQLFRTHAVFAVPPTSGRCPEARLLDAFACGLPVVTSVDALPDPAAIAERHFIASHASSEMARAIVEVLLHRERFDSMALAASRLAMRYDWDRVGETFARVLMVAAQKRRR